MNSSAFWDDYYRQLEGATISKFLGVIPTEEDWISFPTFEVMLRDGSLIEIEISQDPEGNGGGFVFGLPSPK